jgi:hypothetical protein
MVPRRPGNMRGGNMGIGNARRNYEMLGMDRVARDVSADLNAISAHLGAQQATEASPAASQTAETEFQASSEVPEAASGRAR